MLGTIRIDAPLRYMAAALGIRPGEGRRVALVVGASFFLGLSLVFFQTGANAIFLTSFDITALPYVYILNAGLALAFGALHSQLERQLPLAGLLHSTHLLLALVTLLLWAALRIGAGQALIFLAMTWFRLLYIFTRLGLMTLSAAAFDVRQAKRIFVLVGLGMMVAFILGGLLMSRLVAAIGTANLILLAALSLLAYTAALARVAAQLRLPQRAAAPARLDRRALLADRLVLTILAIKSLATLLGFVLEYIFYQQAAANYAGDAALADFLGTFMGLTMLAMVLFTAFLAGRFMSRYGVRAALAATPALLAVLALAAALYGSLVGLDQGFFLLVCLMMALNQIGDKALYGPAVAILYQPLPQLLRTAAMVIAEGWFQAVALLASGLLLILLGWLALATVLPFVYLLLALALGFLWLSAAVYRQYVAKLQQAVAGRFTRGVALDEQLAAVDLAGLLGSSDPGAVLFALQYVSEDAAMPVLAGLLEHPSPDVRLDVLRRVERLRYQPALAQVRRLADAPGQPAHVQGQALITLLALQPAALDQPAALPLALQPYALSGVLRYSGPAARQAACAQIGRLAADDQPAGRLAAVEALRQAPHGDWEELILGLLADPHSAVRRGAIQLAGQHQTPAVRAALLDMLPQTLYRLSLERALAGGGDATVAAIRARFDGLPASAQCAALLICGALGTPAALAFLTRLFAGADGLPVAQSDALLLALRRARYRSDQPQLVVARLRREVGVAETLLRHLRDTPHDLLGRALRLDLAAAKQRLFLLLGLLYDPALIGDIERHFVDPCQRPDANALEMLDVTISGECKRIIVPLLEQPVPAPAPPGPPPFAQLERLRRATDHRQVYSDWTRLCVRYVSALAYPGQLGEQEHPTMFAIVEKVMTLRSVGIFSQTPDPILAEIAACLEEEQAPAGTTIIRKHSLGNQMYIIVAGSVRVHDGDSTICVLEAGELVGELAVLDPAPRAASVTTLTDARFFVLTQDVLYDLMLSRPEVIQSIVRVLIQRIRQSGT